LDQRGLADLACAGDDLQEAARLAQPGGEDGGLGTLERWRVLNTQDIE
jgi:hypothetical protein